MGFDSYAQNQEDVVLQIALAEVESGFYLDVGAFDPIIDSTTHVFYERGWRGINIEPQPHYFKKFCLTRSRDVNLNVAVSDFEGEATFVINDNPGLSHLASVGGGETLAAGERVIVKVSSLNQILMDYPSNQDIHFLKIDVEGAEAQVLNGLNLSVHRPWIILIESRNSQTFMDTSNSWESKLTTSNYFLVYEDGLNSFYLSQEHSDLSPRIGRIPVLLAGYRTQKEIQIEKYSKNLLMKLESVEKANELLTSNNAQLSQINGIFMARNQALYDQLLLVIQERDSRYAELIQALAERDEFVLMKIKRWLIIKFQSRARNYRQKIICIMGGRCLKGILRDFALAVNSRLKRYPRLRLKLIKFLLASHKLEGLIYRILSTNSPIIQSQVTVASDVILNRSIQRLLSLPK